MFAGTLTIHKTKELTIKKQRPQKILCPRAKDMKIKDVLLYPAA